MRAVDFQLQYIEQVSFDSVDTFLEITNSSEQPITNNWRLYYSLGLTPKSSDVVSRVLVEGRYGYLQPTESWRPLASGSSIRLPVETWLFSGMDLLARQGFHVVHIDDKGLETPLGVPKQLVSELTPLTAPRNKFVSEQVNTTSNNQASTHNVVPSVSAQLTKQRSCPGFHILKNDLLVESEHLDALLLDLNLQADDGIEIKLQIDSTRKASSYSLTTDAGAIEITGGDPAGVFYAIQSLRQLLIRTDDHWELIETSIEDSPDYSHRGLFLDIARHFHSLDDIKKIVRAMSSYKMNRLQLGISNDEGWRLEIASIPELTEIGARRSYRTHSEANQRRALCPAWGDGPEDIEGYITGNEFIELLKFSETHHVEVIVEINVPGHANALLRSLEESDTFDLLEPGDESVHQSAQGYRNNIINIAKPDTYRLLKTIVEEVRVLYSIANVPLRAMHFGGDEVPEGTWLHSSACRQLEVWDDTWDMQRQADRENAASALMRFHYSQLKQIVKEITPDTRMGFWHEMSPYVDSGYINCWHTADNNDHAVDDILNRDQSIVISNASYLYLDMPYQMAADEPGLPWAAYIDTSTIFGFQPLGSWGINVEHEHQVLGLQAQLWTETVHSPELLHYYLFPRLLAVAEKAWNKSSHCNWQSFASAIEQRELDHLTSLELTPRHRPNSL